MSMDSDDEITYDSLLIRVYRSGRVERSSIATETTPAGADPATGVSSKDVVIDSGTGVSARLYLPSAPGHDRRKLPVLVYYHGGGFCLGSAFGSLFHHYLNALAAKAGLLAVSVDYRLAPDHPISAAYDDSWLALRWAASHADGRGGEPWLAGRADFSRVLLAGDSAGANIAHDVALRAGGADGAALGGVRLRGVVLVHPYFLSPAPTESEARDPAAARELVSLWAMVSASAGLEDPRINPPAAWRRGRVLVCVAGRDVLRDRGVAYYNKLKLEEEEEEDAGEVALYEAAGQGHTFHIIDPDCDEAWAQDQAICMFINQAINQE